MKSFISKVKKAMRASSIETLEENLINLKIELLMDSIDLKVTEMYNDPIIKFKENCIELYILDKLKILNVFSGEDREWEKESNNLFCKFVTIENNKEIHLIGGINTNNEKLFISRKSNLKFLKKFF